MQRAIVSEGALHQRKHSTMAGPTHPVSPRAPNNATQLSSGRDPRRLVDKTVFRHFRDTQRGSEGQEGTLNKRGPETTCEYLVCNICKKKGECGAPYSNGARGRSPRTVAPLEGEVAGAAEHYKKPQSMRGTAAHARPISNWYHGGR